MSVNGAGATGQSVTVQDGLFVIDGQSYDLGTAMMKLNMDRTKQLDDQIAGKMQDIADKNKKLKELNEMLSYMRQSKAQGLDDDVDVYGGVADTGMQVSLDSTGQKQTLTEWAKDNGITWTDVVPSAGKDTMDGQWDANISAVQAAVDGLNSDNQMAMTQLQSLMNKRNTASDMTTNILSSDKKAMDSITGNLR